MVNEERLKGIGNRIKRVRKERGYSQEHLAELLGVSINTISNYENGKYSFDISRISEMADILDTTEEYLLYGQNNKMNIHSTEMLIQKIMHMTDDEKSKLYRIIEDVF